MRILAAFFQYYLLSVAMNRWRIFASLRCSLVLVSILLFVVFFVLNPENISRAPEKHHQDDNERRLQARKIKGARRSRWHSGFARDRDKVFLGLQRPKGLSDKGTPPEMKNSSVKGGLVNPGLFAAKRPRTVVTSYQVGGGAVNQHLAHVAAFVLSAYLGANLVLVPHPTTRDSFLDQREDRTFREVPFSCVYDLDSIRRHWRQLQGMDVLPSKAPKQDLHSIKTSDNVPFDQALERAPPMIKVQVDEPLPVSLQKWGSAINATLAAAYERNRHIAVLRLPVQVISFPLFQDPAARRLFRYVHLSLKRARPLVAAASAAIDHMMSKSVAAAPRRAEELFPPEPDMPRPFFVGLHLRAEPDMFPPKQNISRFHEAVLEHYGYCLAAVMKHFPPTAAAQAAAAASGYGDLPLFVASGLLELPAAEVRDVLKVVMPPVISASQVYRSCLATAGTRVDSHSACGGAESKAWIDFEVLIRSSVFVGFAGSSFSNLIVQHRELLGMSGAHVLLSWEGAGGDRSKPHDVAKALYRFCIIPRCSELAVQVCDPHWIRAFHSHVVQGPANIKPFVNISC